MRALEIITGHVIFNPTYTYKFQLKTILDTKENPSNDNKYVGEIKISFHTFPADPDLKNVWIKNIERPDWEPTPNSRVCSLHFKESDFQDGRKDKKLKWRKDPTSKLKVKLLLPDAVPILFSSNEIEIEMDRKILALQNKSEPNTNDFQENGDDSQEILENDPLNDVNSSSPLENEDLPLSTFKIKVCFYIKLLFCWVTDVMFHFFYADVKDYPEKFRNSILLPKLFWPTLRRNFSCDGEKVLQIKAEGWEFAKYLRSLNTTIYPTVEGQNNFWTRMLFYIFPEGFSDLLD